MYLRRPHDVIDSSMGIFGYEILQINYPVPYELYSQCWIWDPPRVSSEYCEYYDLCTIHLHDYIVIISTMLYRRKFVKMLGGTAILLWFLLSVLAMTLNLQLDYCHYDFWPLFQIQVCVFQMVLRDVLKSSLPMNGELSVMTVLTTSMPQLFAGYWGLLMALPMPKRHLVKDPDPSGWMTCVALETRRISLIALQTQLEFTTVVIVRTLEFHVIA